MNKLVFDDGVVEEVSDRVWNMSEEKSNHIRMLEAIIENLHVEINNLEGRANGVLC